MGDHVFRSVSRWLHRRGAGRLEVRAGLIVAGAVVALVLVMVVADLVASRRIIQSELEQQAETTARTVAAVAAEKLATGTLGDLAPFATSLVRAGALARIEVHDAITVRTLSVDGSGARTREGAASELAAASIRNGQVFARSEHDHFVVAAPVYVGAALRAAVEVVTSDDLLARKRAESILRSLVVGVLFLLVLVPTMMLLVGRILRPIQDLIIATRRVAKGELDVPVETRRRDEVGRLARAFRRMTKRLERSMSEERRLAYVDPVTGLANRERLHRIVGSMAERAPSDGWPRGLLFVDLDGFKRVNDVFGHDVGDKLLAAVAQRFTGALAREGFRLVDPLDRLAADASPGDYAAVGRQGGDEFVICLRLEGDCKARCATAAAALLASLEAPFEIEGQAIDVGASIGIAMLPEDGPDARTLLRSADLAMYEAKERGRGRYCFYAQDLSQKMLDRLVLEMELRRAIGADEFEVFYMPQVDLADGRIVAFEALARWRHPTRGVLAPAVFIPLAEETGLIGAIDRLVMRKAVKQAAEWAWTSTALRVAVNMSPQEFARPDILSFVYRLLKEHDIPGNLLEIEITESAAMRDPDRAAEAMVDLKRLGVRFAIDDFGTGYSNLGQLLKLPVDVFKIDRSFVQSIETNGEAHHLVKTLVTLAEQMGLETVAEGIETEEQADMIARLGVHLGQGYRFGAPMPLEQAERLIERTFPKATESRWLV
jgi:predicted signal transduction protein with EAL and GGDEF domain